MNASQSTLHKCCFRCLDKRYTKFHSNRWRPSWSNIQFLSPLILTRKFPYKILWKKIFEFFFLRMRGTPPLKLRYK